MKEHQIIVITGDLESGKTSLCLDISRLAKETSIKLTGLVSPGVFKAGYKIAIDVQDLLTGERRRLAELKDQVETDLETKRWSFYPEAVSWGNNILQKATPTELLIIDELGPLEFNRAQGWVKAIDAIDSGEFQTALLVIRPSLVQQASRRWKITRIIDLSGAGLQSASNRELLESFNIQN
jgi:nucleoside-triphosphatase THEP1